MVLMTMESSYVSSSAHGGQLIFFRALDVAVVSTCKVINRTIEVSLWWLSLSHLCLFAMGLPLFATIIRESVSLSETVFRDGVVLNHSTIGPQYTLWCQRLWYTRSAVNRSLERCIDNRYL